MSLAAWGQQERAAFQNGAPLEFILQSEKPLQAGEEVEIKFFNAEGVLSTEKGVVSSSEPGRIQITKA